MQTNGRYLGYEVGDTVIFITTFTIVLLCVLLNMVFYKLRKNQRELKKLKEQKERRTEAFKIYMEETQKEIQALDSLLNDAKSKGYMPDIIMSWERKDARIKSENAFKAFTGNNLYSGMMTEYALNQLSNSVNVICKRW